VETKHRVPLVTLSAYTRP